MKKVLSTVAALGLVAGIATSASALELKVKGTYTVDGFYMDNGAGAAPGSAAGTAAPVASSGYGLQLAGDDTNSDAWLQHMFNIDAELVVNDKISMMSRVRLISWGTVWGVQDDTNINNGNNMSVDKLWMVYKSPIGKWEIGRRSAGAWGLSFIDQDYGGDRIFWGSDKLFGDVFSTYAFYEKLVEGEAYSGTTDSLDSDYAELGATLTGGWGKATLAYGVQQDNTKDSADTPASMSIDSLSYDGTTLFINGTVTPAFYGYETTTHRVKGVGQFKIGDTMGINTEFDYKFGDKDFNSVTKADQDISQFAFLGDFYVTVSGLTGHAMYFHTSGDDNSKDTDLENYYGTGTDFEPLYILTGVFGNILNNSYQGGASASEFGDAAKKAGVNAGVLSADFAATQDLTLHGAIGYGEADNELPGYDSDYGFEYNAGASYKLLDNLV
ncbi:MAG: hypothetical protein Q8R42_00605, partial [Desulfocapsaceae bacterium]|nr:hypothetical protein [Desulfocapsaceae bacterium]